MEVCWISLGTDQMPLPRHTPQQRTSFPAPFSTSANARNPHDGESAEACDSLVLGLDGHLPLNGPNRRGCERPKDHPQGLFRHHTWRRAYGQNRARPVRQDCAKGETYVYQTKIQILTVIRLRRTSVLWRLARRALATRAQASTESSRTS